MCVCVHACVRVRVTCLSVGKCFLRTRVCVWVRVERAFVCVCF
jgi:hypothetical protein